MHGELHHGCTAVIYARFSRSKQREASIEDQVRECQSFAIREGIQFIRTYSDHAKSEKTDDRPAFQEMISNAGESDLVLVYMMDRFSRDQYDAPVYKQELKRKGVRLVSAMESIVDAIRTSMEPFEVADMADFLQLGSTMDEETILGAFVHSVIVDRGCIVAVLNCGNEKGEPFLIEKVRLDNVWLPG